MTTIIKTKQQKNKKMPPKKLSGFRDFFGKDMQIRNFVLDTFKEVFEKYGYEPLETPALEYSELMLGQSGEEAEKQYYRFTDSGGRDVMLKYEVMISMCRAVAENINNIPLPYKRYQIQRVWRAEKPQKGRYREFTQCDADTIGSSSVWCDAEFIQMGIEIVGKLGFKQFEARISNRKFLEGLAEYLNLPTDQFYGFYIAIDKLEKIGREKVIEDMVDKRGISSDIAEKAMDIVSPKSQDPSATKSLPESKKKAFREKVGSFRETVGTTKVGAEALDELDQMQDYFELVDLDEKYYRFDPSIARGLASYTGPVWEFTVIEGGVGSIGGCGRYDKAIGKYIGGEVPATGGSFGIERICDIIKDRKMFEVRETPAVVMVTVFDEDLAGKSVEVADKFRSSKIPTMLYPDNDKLGKQLKYADKKEIPFTVIVGPQEVEGGVVKLKDMKAKTEQDLSLDKAVKFVGSKVE